MSHAITCERRATTPQRFCERDHTNYIVEAVPHTHAGVLGYCGVARGIHGKLGRDTLCLHRKTQKGLNDFMHPGSPSEHEPRPLILPSALPALSAVGVPLRVDPRRRQQQ